MIRIYGFAKTSTPFSWSKTVTCKFVIKLEKKKIPENLFTQFSSYFLKKTHLPNSAVISATLQGESLTLPKMWTPASRSLIPWATTLSTAGHSSQYTRAATSGVSAELPNLSCQNLKKKKTITNCVNVSEVYPCRWANTKETLHLEL